MELNEIIKEIKEKIDNFQMVNASALDEIVESSKPYYEVEGSNDIEEVQEWIDDFIFALTGNISQLEELISWLETKQREIDNER